MAAEDDPVLQLMEKIPGLRDLRNSKGHGDREDDFVYIEHLRCKFDILKDFWQCFVSNEDDFARLMLHIHENSIKNYLDYFEKGKFPKNKTQEEIGKIIESKVGRIPRRRFENFLIGIGLGVEKKEFLESPIADFKEHWKGKVTWHLLAALDSGRDLRETFPLVVFDRVTYTKNSIECGSEELLRRVGVLIEGHGLRTEFAAEAGAEDDMKAQNIESRYCLSGNIEALGSPIGTVFCSLTLSGGSVPYGIDFKAQESSEYELSERLYNEILNKIEIDIFESNRISLRVSSNPYAIFSVAKRNIVSMSFRRLREGISDLEILSARCRNFHRVFAWLAQAYLYDHVYFDGYAVIRSRVNLDESRFKLIWDNIDKADEEIAKNSSQSRLILAVIADYYRLSGNSPTAEYWANKLTYQHSTYAHGWHIISNISMVAGNFKSARREIGKAIRLGQSDVRLWMYEQSLAISFFLEFIMSDDPVERSSLISQSLASCRDSIRRHKENNIFSFIIATYFCKNPNKEKELEGININDIEYLVERIGIDDFELSSGPKYNGKYPIEYTVERLLKDFERREVVIDIVRSVFKYWEDSDSIVIHK